MIVLGLQDEENGDGLGEDGKARSSRKSNDPSPVNKIAEYCEMLKTMVSGCVCSRVHTMGHGPFASGCMPVVHFSELD